MLLKVAIGDHRDRTPGSKTGLRGEPTDEQPPARRLWAVGKHEAILWAAEQIHNFVTGAKPALGSDDGRNAAD